MSYFVKIPISQNKLLLTNIYLLLFSLMYGIIAFGLSAFSANTKKVNVILPSLIAFLGYLLTSLSGLNNLVLDFSKALPYHYFSPSNLMNGQVSNGLNVYIVIVFIVMITLSFYGFSRRDLV